MGRIVTLRRAGIQNGKGPGAHINSQTGDNLSGRSLPDVNRCKSM